jgi:hypothetical protein
MARLIEHGMKAHLRMLEEAGRAREELLQVLALICSRVINTTAHEHRTFVHIPARFDCEVSDLSLPEPLSHGRRQVPTHPVRTHPPARSSQTCSTGHRFWLAQPLSSHPLPQVGSTYMYVRQGPPTHLSKSLTISASGVEPSSYSSHRLTISSAASHRAQPMLNLQKAFHVDK